MKIREYRNNQFTEIQDVSSLSVMSRSLKQALGIAATVGVIMLPHEAFAQDDPVLEEVLVTGSNIRRDTFSATSPVTTMDGELIDKLGESSIGEFLARLPSVTSNANDSTTAGNNPQSTGLSTVALRNLGAARTLVLVNGRRFVSGTSAGAGYGVDLNAIPQATIARVEVLTGAQSAVYGSDAIAGVVNIITRNDIDGVEFDMQYGESGDSDRETTKMSLTVGKSFGDNGNAWISLEYVDREAVATRDRNWSEFSETGVDTDGDGLADELQFEGSSFIPESRLIGGGLSIKGDGSEFEGSRNLATTDRLNFYDFATLALPSTRKIASAGLAFDLSEKSRASLELNYSRVESATQFTPLPLNTLNETFRVNRGGTSGIDLATHPLWEGSSAGSQFLAAGLTSFDELDQSFRRVVEFGQLGASNVRTTFRVAGAVDYEFNDDLRLELSAVYGITDQNQTNFGDINLERAATALDIEPNGTGGYQCVSAVARLQGCVPYNPFNTNDSTAGLAGVTGFSDEAKSYLEAKTGLEGNIEQTVVTAVFTGAMPFSFGDQAQVQYAAGMEYRKEEGEEVPDGLRQKGLTRILTILPTGGDFDVTEIYGELLIPVLPKLSIDLAGRYGDYSTVGKVGTLKIGLNAPITDSIRLRGAASSAIRAPNVSDLLAGRVNQAQNIADPCNGVDANTGGVVAQNCRSVAAIASRIDEQGSFELTQIETQGTRVFTAGSPIVEEETSTSYTFGAVYTPENHDAFSLAIDFYDIEIEDAIKLTNASVLLDRCFNASAASFDSSCNGNLLRDNGSGAALEIDSISNNEETIETAGFDIEASYLFDDLGPGDLQLTLLANVLTKYEITDSEGDTIDRKGEVLFPEYQFNFNLDYTVANFNFFTQMRYRDDTVDRNENPVLNNNLNDIDSSFYVDMRASYEFNDSINFYIGANNVFDEDPPEMGFSHQYRDTGNTNSVFDVIGRQMFAGVNIKL